MALGRGKPTEVPSNHISTYREQFNCSAVELFFNNTLQISVLDGWRRGDVVAPIWCKT